MLVVDALIVVALVAATVVAGTALAGRSSRTGARADAAGSRELAQAMRLLDRVRAVDDAVPQLPSTLRTEVDRVVTTYYKEIER